MNNKKTKKRCKITYILYNMTKAGMRYTRVILKSKRKCEKVIIEQALDYALEN